MVDNKKHIDAERLYRRYQETRDNIPFSILSNLAMHAESARQEEAIHAIVEAAKVASHTAQEGISEPTKKSLESASIVEKIKRLLFGNEFSRTVAVGFACLAMVAVLSPMLMTDSRFTNFPDTAHLANCQQCDTYILNAVTATRGTQLGTSQVSPSDKVAARLGLIQARLKIEALQNQSMAVTNAVTQLAKLPASLLSNKISDLSSEDADVTSLLLTISQASRNSAITNASDALFVANITSRYLRESQQSNFGGKSFELALTALATIPDPTPLQKAATEKLAQTLQSKPRDLDKLLKDIEFASRSLGI